MSSFYQPITHQSESYCSAKLTESDLDASITANTESTNARLLSDRARKNYPDSQLLQNKWLHAISVVRSTSRGWLLDQPIHKSSRG